MPVFYLKRCCITSFRGQYNGLSWHFDDFEVTEVSCIDGETDERPYRMPSLQSCCPGVDVEQSKRFVVLHFQYVTMSRDEEFGRSGKDL